MLVGALALAFLLAGPAHAFRVVYELPGGSQFLGIAVAWPHLIVADAVDGDRFQEDTGGVVTVYDGRTGNSLWKLRDPETSSGGFGNFFSASGQWVAAANPATESVHVFDREGGFVRTVRAVTPDAYLRGVAIGGDVLLLRALHTSGPGPAVTLIDVFDVSTGNLLTTISGEPLETDFGDAMVLAGDLAIVSNAARGRVCAFETRTGIERWCTSSPSRYGGDLFGVALGVDGNDLLVGAPGGHRLEFGNAYLLDVRTGEIRRKYHGRGRGSSFGAAVAVQRNRVLIGAPEWYARKRRRGRTYLLDKSGEVLHIVRPARSGGVEVYTGRQVAFVGYGIGVVDEWNDPWRFPIIRVFR